MLGVAWLVPERVLLLVCAGLSCFQRLAAVGHPWGSCLLLTSGSERVSIVEEWLEPPCCPQGAEGSALAKVGLVQPPCGAYAVSMWVNSGSQGSAGCVHSSPPFALG